MVFVLLSKLLSFSSPEISLKGNFSQICLSWIRICIKKAAGSEAALRKTAGSDSAKNGSGSTALLLELTACRQGCLQDRWWPGCSPWLCCGPPASAAGGHSSWGARRTVRTTTNLCDDAAETSIAAIPPSISFMLPALRIRLDQNYFARSGYELFFVLYIKIVVKKLQKLKFLKFA